MEDGVPASNRLHATIYLVVIAIAFAMLGFFVFVLAFVLILILVLIIVRCHQPVNDPVEESFALLDGEILTLGSTMLAVYFVQLLLQIPCPRQQEPSLVLFHG